MLTSVRRSVMAVAVLAAVVLAMAPSASAVAVDISLTSGSIVKQTDTLDVQLFGSNFSYEPGFDHAGYSFTKYIDVLHPAGTRVDLSGFVLTAEQFLYDGVFYDITGQVIEISVHGRIPVTDDPQKTHHRRFSLNADLHGRSFGVVNGEFGVVAEIDVTLTGAGWMTAGFAGDSPERLALYSMIFTIGQIPERSGTTFSIAQISEPSLIGLLLAASALGLILVPRSATPSP